MCSPGAPVPFIPLNTFVCTHDRRQWGHTGLSRSTFELWNIRRQWQALHQVHP